MILILGVVVFGNVFFVLNNFGLLRVEYSWGFIIFVRMYEKVVFKKKYFGV